MLFNTNANSKFYINYSAMNFVIYTRATHAESLQLP